MKIGKNIRSLRKKNSVTLDELSRKSGVALATLSRMENDKMTGTLGSHIKICKALNTSLGDFYRAIEDTHKPVDKFSTSELLAHSKKQSIELLVSSPSNKKLMPLLISLDAGMSTSKEKNATGTEKFLYVTKGSLEAMIGENVYKLKQGDSLYFDASLPHSFKNNGNSRSQTLCVISGT
jgi:transcriptional regulator with XRE-family HTH domain